MAKRISTARRGSRAHQVAVVSAALSLGAAAIHFWVVPEHLREERLFGVFFIVVATGQTVWAVSVARWPQGRTYLAGALGSLLLIVLWALSRTTGLPLGHHPWEAESVGALDVTCVVLEVLITMLALLVLAPLADVRQLRVPLSRRRGSPAQHRR